MNILDLVAIALFVALAIVWFYVWKTRRKVKNNGENLHG